MVTVEIFFLSLMIAALLIDISVIYMVREATMEQCFLFPPKWKDEAQVSSSAQRLQCLSCSKLLSALAASGWFARGKQQFEYIKFRTRDIHISLPSASAAGGDDTGQVSAALSSYTLDGLCFLGLGDDRHHRCSFSQIDHCDQRQNRESDCWSLYSKSATVVAHWGLNWPLIVRDRCCTQGYKGSKQLLCIYICKSTRFNHLPAPHFNQRSQY